MALTWHLVASLRYGTYAALPGIIKIFRAYSALSGIIKIFATLDSLGKTFNAVTNKEEIFKYSIKVVAVNILELL